MHLSPMASYVTVYVRLYDSKLFQVIINELQRSFNDITMVWCYSLWLFPTRSREKIRGQRCTINNNVSKISSRRLSVGPRVSYTGYVGFRSVTYTFRLVFQRPPETRWWRSSRTGARCVWHRTKALSSRASRSGVRTLISGKQPRVTRGRSADTSQ